jgi:hypothetical protein
MKTASQKAEAIVNSQTFEAFHASFHRDSFGDAAPVLRRPLVYLRGKTTDQFRTVSSSRFLRIVAGKEQWI